ncbi:uncharacterized protein MONOS_17519 [Monocercomonoides exilis]|uniref:uncharacterized protein n=1 Tax=Monocercomonoides exilis TaxID=2049356 RepID=UPI00355A1484|nr:hypothetical protein MONOS_17519 [Monocercomonoides exilis]
MKQSINPDVSFMSITFLFIELTMRIAGLILSFHQRSAELFDIYFFSCILASCIAFQIQSIPNLLVKLVILVHLGFDIALSSTHMLLTLQSYAGEWRFHDLIFIPTIMKILNIVGTATQTCLFFFLWIMFKKYENPAHPPDDPIGFQSFSLRHTKQSVFALPEDVFARVCKDQQN